MRLDHELRQNQEHDAPPALVLAEEFAKPFERLFLSAYFDPVLFDKWGRPAGFPTQGWGHLLIRKTKRTLMEENSLDFGSREDHDKYERRFRARWPDWDRETADRWLRSDMREAYLATNRLLPVPLTPAQRAPCVDFTFNLGAGNLQASTLRRLILRGDMDGAADQFLRWNKAGGVVLRGLTKRCKARRAAFLMT